MRETLQENEAVLLKSLIFPAGRQVEPTRSLKHGGLHGHPSMKWTAGINYLQPSTCLLSLPPAGSASFLLSSSVSLISIFNPPLSFHDTRVIYFPPTWWLLISMHQMVTVSDGVKYKQARHIIQARSMRSTPGARSYTQHSLIPEQQNRPVCCVANIM